MWWIWIQSSNFKRVNQTAKTTPTRIEKTKWKSSGIAQKIREICKMPKNENLGTYITNENKNLRRYSVTKFVRRRQ